MSRLDGVIVVITGASSGLGAAIARRFARDAGARLLLVARRADRLDALSEETGGTVLAADLTADDSPDRIAKRVEDDFGRLDVLVNNAGAHHAGAFATTGWPNIRAAMALNFDAHVRVTEALLPILRDSTPSAVINVGSVAGRVGLAGSGAYSASKFALSGWSEALYAEERPHGVHVGLILPGFVATEGFEHNELRRRWYTRWTVSTDDKVAKAVLAMVRRRTSERYVPRAWRLVPTSARLTPGLFGRASPTLRP